MNQGPGEEFPRARAPAVEPAAEGASDSNELVTSASEGPFRAVADYTYDWEAWHDVDGRLLWVNPAVERATGFSVRQCQSMSDYPLPIVVPEDRPLVARALADARQRISGENVEFRVCREDGTQLRWMSLCWQPIYSEAGSHLGFRTSIRDITERQQLREQLRMHAEHLEQLVERRTERIQQLERRTRQMEKVAALGQLAAGAAHEINNPLAGIRNAFELIKASLSPAHRHYDLLELIDREIERVSGIVHQMFQLYRRQPQAATRFDLQRSVDEVAFLLGNVAAKQHVTIRSVAVTAPFEVYLPEGEVKQVLYNLICNAVQASPVGGEVVIQVDADDQTASVRVRDAGPGIASELQQRIFDPFFTTKHSDAQGGMGLGLSVSRSFIDALGGRIELQSEFGAGSEFTAVFPRSLDVTREALA